MVNDNCLSASPHTPYPYPHQITISLKMKGAYWNLLKSRDSSIIEWRNVWVESMLYFQAFSALKMSCIGLLYSLMFCYCCSDVAGDTLSGLRNHEKLMENTSCSNMPRSFWRPKVVPKVAGNFFFFLEEVPFSVLSQSGRDAITWLIVTGLKLPLQFTSLEYLLCAKTYANIMDIKLIMTSLYTLMVKTWRQRHYFSKM